MRRYEGVLLDVDGTLVASNDAHASCWVEAFAEFGVTVEWARMRRLIGLGGDRIIATLSGDAKASPRSKAITAWRDRRFVAHWLPHVQPLPSTREFLLALRSAGYPYALATSARDAELEPLLEIAGIADLCPLRASGSMAGASKPAPDVVEAALALIGIARTRAVMIGDTPYDVQAGGSAGVDVLGVTTGGCTAEDLAGAVGVYDGPAGLLASGELF